MANEELLVNCRFYFYTDKITDKMILEVSGLTSETPAAGGDKVLGSGKDAKNFRQPTPTQVKFGTVTVKVVATNNTDLYKWYENCNKNEGGASQWKDQLQNAFIAVYDQAGTEQAKWTLKESYPVKYEGPKLEAGSNDVANESITLVHKGLIREK